MFFDNTTDGIVWNAFCSVKLFEIESFERRGYLLYFNVKVKYLETSSTKLENLYSIILLFFLNFIDKSKTRHRFYSVEILMEEQRMI